MPFASGSISFRRYAVIGADVPTIPCEPLLEKLDQAALHPGELGVPEPTEWGWSGGRHVLDAEFAFAHNVFNDCLTFALRIDTNKIPGETKKAYQQIEEQAAAKGNPSGFISKKQKADVRSSVTKQVEDELRSGRHRKSKLVPILWDLPSKTLYAASSNSDQEKLLELFERSFGLTLQLLSSGTVAMRTLESAGNRRTYEDLKPTRFVTGPGGDGQVAEYPWVAKSAEKADFLGNEFCLWLWHVSECGYEAEPRSFIPTAADDVTVMFDKSIDLDCVFGDTGRDSLRGTSPTKMAEAIKALQAGKIPRKAGLILDAHSQQYTLTLGAELLSVSGLTMPPIENADSPRTFFEERIDQLRDFMKAFDTLYATFLQERTSAHWESTVAEIRKWIQTQK